MKMLPPRYLLAATVLLLTTFPLHASTILPPGGTISPVEGVIVPANIDDYVIDDIQQSFFFTPNQFLPYLSGHIDEAVLFDPFGLTCPTCLDFAFQVVVNSDSAFSVYQAVLGSFAGFTVNAVYALPSTDTVPDSAARGGGGAAVGFRFGTDANPTLGPDQSSVFMLIATNATRYDSSGVLNIGGSNGGSCTTFDFNHCRGGQISGFFAPTNAPEPSSALLFGLGLTAIAALRKRLV